MGGVGGPLTSPCRYVAARIGVCVQLSVHPGKERGHTLSDTRAGSQLGEGVELEVLEEHLNPVAGGEKEKQFQGA